MKIILASASKRRQELLKSLGVNFITIPSKVKEEKISISSPKKLALNLALRKAQAVAIKIPPPYLIISADTIVVKDGVIYGKPKTKKEAAIMLINLSDSIHYVLTAITCINNSGIQLSKLTKTKVLLKKFNLKDIKSYLKQKLYLDRAGGYGIQDEKFPYVSQYWGSYTNILGLPLETLLVMFKKFGVKIKE